VAYPNVALRSGGGLSFRSRSLRVECRCSRCVPDRGRECSDEVNAERGLVVRNCGGVFADSDLIVEG